MLQMQSGTPLHVDVHLPCQGAVLRVRVPVSASELRRARTTPNECMAIMPHLVDYGDEPAKVLAGGRDTPRREAGVATHEAL